MHVPAKLQAGFLDDEGKPKGTPVDITIEKAGCAVPNYSRVWGRLLRHGTKANPGELNGEFETAKWGSNLEGYGIIELRFLPTFSSLSKEYQELKKVKLQDKDAEINLMVGVNDFDAITDARKIKFLELHYQNGSNECRDPSVPVAFETYDPTAIKRRTITEIQKKQEAQNMVIAANYDPEALEILASLFDDIDPRQQNDILFNTLMDRATESHGQFLLVVEHYRKLYEEILEKSKEVGLIDVDPLNSIFIKKEGGSDVLLEEIECGAMKKELYIIQHYYEPKFFNALTKLKRELAKYTELAQ